MGGTSAASLSHALASSPFPGDVFDRAKCVCGGSRFVLSAPLVPLLAACANKGAAPIVLFHLIARRKERRAFPRQLSPGREKKIAPITNLFPNSYRVLICRAPETNVVAGSSRNESCRFEEVVRANSRPASGPPWTSGGPSFAQWPVESSPGQGGGAERLVPGL